MSGLQCYKSTITFVFALSMIGISIVVVMEGNDHRLRKTRRHFKQPGKSHLAFSHRVVSEQNTSSPCGELTFRPCCWPLTALASFPGSGNTWTRHLMQQATGGFLLTITTLLFFQFETITHVLVLAFSDSFEYRSMLWIYDHYKYGNYFSAGTVCRRQFVTYKDGLRTERDTGYGSDVGLMFDQHHAAGNWLVNSLALKSLN